MADENQKDNQSQLPEEIRDEFDKAIQQSEAPSDDATLKEQAKKCNQIGDDIIQLVSGMNEIMEGDTRLYKPTDEQVKFHISLSGEAVGKLGVSRINFINFDPDYIYEEGEFILGSINSIEFASNAQPNVGFKTDKCLIIDIPDPHNLRTYAELFPLDHRIVRTFEKVDHKSVVYFFNPDGDMAKLVKMSAKLAREQNLTPFYEGFDTVYIKEPITQVDIKLAQDSLNLVKALI